jgi:hypothetical protein
LMTLLE